MKPYRALSVAILGGFAASAAAAQRAESADSSRAVAVHREWWRAFTYGDDVTLSRRSDSVLRVVLSSGRLLDRTAALSDARSRGDSAGMRLAWSEERAIVVGDVATIHSRFTEQTSGQSSNYRLLTVVRRNHGQWQMLAAQSTLIPGERRTVAVDRQELADIAGRYRGSGLELTLAATDSGLTLTGLPQGSAFLKPLAPARYAVIGTSIQIIFVRARDGRVQAFDALTPTGDLHLDRVP